MKLLPKEIKESSNYLFTPIEKQDFLTLEPNAEPYFRRWVGSEEFINGIERWCLLLRDCSPADLRKMPECLKRVEAVKNFRLASKSPSTRKIAATPTRFHVENFPTSKYLIIPEVSSEKRSYIPIAFGTPKEICSNKVRLFPGATLWHFGNLTSGMHMAWVRQVTGRLESRFQWSVTLVYNNYPWPDADSKQTKKVEECAQAVLDAREPFLKSGNTLADLYNPVAMPAALVKAHQALDRAVEKCYRAEAFSSDRHRVEYLFQRHQALTAPLLPATKKGRKGK